ncbi:Na(+)/H(+) antiporter NhaA [Streptomyces avidinii]
MAAPSPTDHQSRKLLSRLLSLPERRFVADALRTETVGGVLLLVAAIAALVWANIPAIADSYAAVRSFHIGPASLGWTSRSSTGRPTASSPSSSSSPASSSSASSSRVI